MRQSNKEVESTALRFLNNRLAELNQQYQIRPTRQEIAEEHCELGTIRDQLKTIGERLIEAPKASQLSSSEFPTLGAFVHRLNTVGRQIATTRKDNPHRHALLNEMTCLWLLAHSGCEREL